MPGAPLVREVNAAWVNTEFLSAQLQRNSEPQKTSIKKTNKQNILTSNA